VYAEPDWDALPQTLNCDTTVKEVSLWTPGPKAAKLELKTFLKDRLANYSESRNTPALNHLSRLSPWLHYGQISAHYVAKKAKEHSEDYKKDVDAFFEELVVRRELSDNYCLYNTLYDSFEGLPGWAKKTLDEHRKDKRPRLYTKQQLEAAQTYDQLWNASQLELVHLGKLHGYLRMYWAKKILEWTSSPEEALSVSIYLNDKYSMDGRDPNGYVGCAWSVGGVHDRGWKEREVFGKIRYMNFDGCKRKFNIDNYCARVQKDIKRLKQTSTQEEASST